MSIELIDQLNACRQRAESALQGVNPGIVVFAATDSTPAWTVKDLVGHITTWEEEMLKSWLAHLEGKVHTVDGDEDLFNNDKVILSRDSSYEQILENWHTVRAKVVEAISQATPQQLEEEFTLAWDERGTLALAVKGLVWHEDLHINDIAQAVRG